MKPLKIGVIGLGLRSRLITAFKDCNLVEIVAVADLEQKKLDGFDGDVLKTTNYRELLACDKVEAVFIITQDHQHEDVAVAALESGKAVYLEKPMAITVKGCDRILETAFRTGSKLFVGHNMRYMPFVLKMKALIGSGIIGNVQAVWCRHFISYGGTYFHHWCSERKNSNGLLLQKGAHDIDVIHWLADAYTKRVVGMGMLSIYDKCIRRAPAEPVDRNEAWAASSWPPAAQKKLSPNIDIEDHNMVMLQLENGVQASYMQCHYSPDAERNYTFIGDRGRLENIGDGGHCEIHVWTSRGSRREPDVIHRLKPLEGSHGGADPLIVKAFVAFVRDGVVPHTSPVAARQAVAAGALGHASMRNGNVPMVVPPLSEHITEYFNNGQKKTGATKNANI